MDQWTRIVMVFRDDTGTQSLTGALYEDEDTAKAALEEATRLIPRKYGEFILRRVLVQADGGGDG